MIRSVYRAYSRGIPRTAMLDAILGSALTHRGPRRMKSFTASGETRQLAQFVGEMPRGMSIAVNEIGMLGET